MKQVYKVVSAVCGTIFLVMALFYNTPFQIFGVYFPFFLMGLTIIIMFVMKKVANQFIEETDPNNVEFNEYIKNPKVLRIAVISTVTVLVLIILSLTVFSSGVDISEFGSLRFILLDQGWEIMNYIGLPFFHFGTITVGGFAMSNYEPPIPSN